MAQASALIQIGDPSPEAPFDLVAHPDDDARALKPVYDFVHYWARPRFRDGGLQRIPLTLVRYGVAPLRLYTDRSDVSVTVLDRLHQPEKSPPVVKMPGGTFPYQGSGFSGRQLVYRGRAESVETETIAFSGDSRQRIKYWHGSPATTLLFRSDFVDAGGVSVPPPRPVGGGWFASDRPVYGTLLVSYPAVYRSYDVYYDLPDAHQVVEAGSDGSLIAFRDIPRSPLPIFARAGHLAATVTLDRVGALPAIKFGNDGGDVSDYNGVETARDTSPESVERVFSTVDPTQYVDVARPRWITLTDERGRVLTLRFNP